MARRNPPAKWVLPDVVNPSDHICFTIEVPRNRYHLAAFRGAILNLCSAINWQDDLAHTAKDVAAVWMDVYDKIAVCKPDNPLVNDKGITLEELMSTQIRLKPSDPCIIQMWCIDDWQDWYDPRACGPIGSQPGSGSPQPGAGQCQTYHAELPANGLWVIPTQVSEGDVITLSNALGAGNDDSLGWKCPDGRTFFAGDCVGFPSFQGGDIESTIYHMRVMCKIDGVYYDPFAGPITVPSGVLMANAEFLVNDAVANRPTDVGSYTFDVEVCNNQLATWIHTFNFNSNVEGFENVIEGGVTPNTSGVYTPGVGWTNSQVVGATNTRDGVDITRQLSGSTTITDASVLFDLTKGSITAFPVSSGIYFTIGGVDVINFTASSDTISDGINILMSIPTGSYAIDNVALYIRDASYANGTGSNGYAAIKQLVISGIGVDPF